MISHGAAGPETDRTPRSVLVLGTLGIVYGDIGTSPLYAFRESFHPEYGIGTGPANVLGILSLIFWSLILVISIKYLVFVLRADSRGEGGILILASLVTPMGATRVGGRWLLILMGLFGAALLYGDGMITPAISVLSAVEGLEVATPFFEPYIIPVTVAILLALFAVQSRGTAGVAKLFGPITLVWFVTLAVLGLRHIIREPAVLTAVSPVYGWEFFVRNGWLGFLVLGSVFLVVTGGEALYADLGHFGKKPIRTAWFSVVLPALVLNYFGQGALLLRDPGAVENPFYAMAPGWAIYPVVVIATLATVIASQAVISGAFSLTRQAVQLGYAPRVEIEHTSARKMGQIYIPGVNWALMVASIGLVVGFGTSSNLAAAYGVAVTTTMVITTLLLFAVQRERWKWPLASAGLFTAFFLTIDLAFFGANILKVPDGGWFPLVVAGIIFILMSTWKRGRQILAERQRSSSIPIELFLPDISEHPPARVPGTAIFMYGDPEGTPPALLHNLKHNKVLHEQVLFLSVVTEETARVPEEERIEIEALPGGECYWLTLRYGFMEDPDVPGALETIEDERLDLAPMRVSYFLGRETLIATKEPGMAIWRERLFVLMSRNARTATSFFCLPPNRVVELGAQIRL